MLHTCSFYLCFMSRQVSVSIMSFYTCCISLIREKKFATQKQGMSCLDIGYITLSTKHTICCKHLISAYFKPNVDKGYGKTRKNSFYCTNVKRRKSYCNGIGYSTGNDRKLIP